MKIMTILLMRALDKKKTETFKRLNRAEWAIKLIYCQSITVIYWYTYVIGRKTEIGINKALKTK